MILKKFYTAKYDRVFKKILCNEEDTGLLQEFLSRILKKKVEVIEFLRNELPVTTTEEKMKTVDVLVKVDGEYVHSEININNGKYLHTRNFIYFSALYCRKVQRGEEYDLETKFLHLDLTYHLGLEKDECTHYYIQSSSGEKYLENIEIVEYNMDRIMNYWYNEDKEKVLEYRHLIMLDLKTNDLKKLSKGDDFVKEFESKVTDLNEKETFQSAMTYEEDQKLILNTEKRISFNEGKEEKQIEIAKTMLNKVMDIQVISECTGLSIEEIERLNI